MLKTIIDLENTAFSFQEIIGSLPTTMAWVSNKPILQKVSDFGLVIFPDSNGNLPSEEMIRLLVSDSTPLFCAPRSWRWPHLLRALGAFSSATAASKNGWNKDIIPGFDEATVRINKIRGSVATFKMI